MTALANLTTLRVGGPIRTLVEPTSEAELLEAVKAADGDEQPLLMLGGGSNLLAADAPFNGTVIRDARRDISVQDDGMCGGVSVTVAAGVPWDQVVERAVTEGWVGIEALSGIPGSTGATPIQNVGAYGAEVADVLALVRVWDRLEQRVRSIPRVDCQFAYRDSIFKRSMSGGAPDGAVWHPTPRFVVLDVTFQMRQGDLSAPIRYAQLAAALGTQEGERAPLVDVRQAVLHVRGAKGMVLSPGDHDTWSAGSFFTNPFLSADAAAALPAEAPRFPGEDGRVKTSAAWLIEHAGFSRGFAVRDDARATLSTKHTLALTNRGSASASDVLELARTVRDGVRAKFDIELVPEPVLLGATL